MNVAYQVLNLERVDSNYGEQHEKSIIATLVYTVDNSIVKVFLPSRVDASTFTDDELASYNESEKNMYLYYHGMIGRCIHVTFNTL
jgi:hypothetical protein